MWKRGVVVVALLHSWLVGVLLSLATIMKKHGWWWRYHKPRGVLSTTFPHHKGNILSSLCPEDRQAMIAGVVVVPVGRLDKDSSGLILLTTADDVAGKLLRSDASFSRGGLCFNNAPFVGQEWVGVRYVKCMRWRQGEELVMEYWIVYALEEFRFPFEIGVGTRSTSSHYHVL